MLSINGNTSKAGDTGLPVKWKAALELCNDEVVTLTLIVQEINDLWIQFHV